MPVSLEVIDAAVEGGAAQIQAEKTIGLDTSVLSLYLSKSGDPDPHLAFGHASHFCIGAARARIAIRDLIARLSLWESLETQLWEPRSARHMHGPPA